MRKPLLIALVVFGAIAVGVAMRLAPSRAPGDAAPVMASVLGTQTPNGHSKNGGPEPMTSGADVAIKFSDKPIALPSMLLRDLDGHAISTDAWHGKVVLLNFWATWCGPCREEIPALVALQEHYRDQLIVIGLSIDTAPVSQVKAFVERVGVNYPVAIADNALQAAFGGISAVPSTFVVKPDGTIIQRHVGGIDPSVIEHEVRVLSNLPSPASVQVVKDTGQVLLANAAFATEIPGVDFSHCTPPQKEAVLKQLNTEHCTCGCGLTIAQCRINDPNCQTSLPLAQKMLERIVR